MSKVTDLTLTYSNEMKGVSLDDFCTVEKEGWNAKMLHIYSHAGTHLDAPHHFGVKGPYVDEISVEKFIGKAWLLDLSGIEPKALINVADLGDLQTKVKTGDSLVIKTGWSNRITETSYRDELPRISEGLALWLAERKIKMLAVEPPSVADVNNLDEVTSIHKILLGAEIVIIEGITNLSALKNETFTLIALPIKIENGDGAPARVIAIEE